MKGRGTQIFWAYLDEDGKVHVKKYVNDRIIRNYESMPFVKGIFDPFRARDMHEARIMVYARYIQELH
jgi:hypothetical protein